MVVNRGKMHNIGTAGMALLYCQGDEVDNVAYWYTNARYGIADVFVYGSEKAYRRILHRF